MRLSRVPTSARTAAAAERSSCALCGLRSRHSKMPGKTGSLSATRATRRGTHSRATQSHACAWPAGSSKNFLRSRLTAHVTAPAASSASWVDGSVARSAM